MKKIQLIKSSRYLKDNEKIDLLKYAKIVIENFKDEIIKARKEIGLRYDQLRLSGNDERISSENFEDIKLFNKIVSRKGRNKYLWYGLVYEITEIYLNREEGQSYCGSTIRTLSKRWHDHLYTALEDLSAWERPLYSRIREILFNELGYDIEDLQHKNGKWNWKIIHSILDQRFNRKVRFVCFSQRSLYNTEKEFIESNNLIDDGFNLMRGGSYEKIDLPMLSIALYIALGYNIEQITEIINNRHSISCSSWVVRRRIKDYWGSFEDAQVKFLKPVLEMLIKARFEQYEINDAFSRFMYERYEVFFSRSYDELLDIINEDWSELPIFKEIPKWTRQGRPESKFDPDFLKEIVLKFLSAKDAVASGEFSQFGRGDYQLMYQIKNQLGYPSFDYARDKIEVPYIIQWLKEGLSGKDIFTRIGYKSSSAARSHNKYCQRLFFGMNTEEARAFFKRNPTVSDLREALEIFILERGRYPMMELSLAELNRIILKSASPTIASQKAAMLEYQFLDQVNLYYNSWNEARKFVVSTFLIEQLRGNEDFRVIFNQAGYNTPSSYNTYCQRIFKFEGIIQGLKAEEVRVFLRLCPWINTLSEFEIAYKNKYVGNL